MKPKASMLRLAGAQTALVCALLWVLVAPPALAQSSLDFGDAPESYATLLKDNGPRHTATGPQLGFARDTENDGFPDALALGDDNIASDDEDGVTFVSALAPGQLATIHVTVLGAPNGARLEGWVDFGIDGTFAPAGDRIFSSRLVTNGLNVLTFAVPAAAKVGVTYARFRISFNGDLNFTGAASSGEVEDYRVGIGQPMDFADAPVSQGTVGIFNYPTTLAQNGARHTIVQGLMLGNIIDAEPDGQPTLGATGDDMNPAGVPDDEDGVLFPVPLTAGQIGSVEVACTVPAGLTARLNAWMDFNRDGDWDDDNEHILIDVPVVNGLANHTFPVPGSAVGGTTYARFRLNRDGKLSPRGSARDGEVEDHTVNITAALDYGDAPNDPKIGGNYPTTLAQNGARHVFSPDFTLGKIVDGETDGQPKPDADGDDSNGADDEDGIFFAGSITPGLTVQVQAIVALPAGFNLAYLNAWIDFNRDGDWDDQGEHIFAPRVVTNGANILTFTVPSTAIEGVSFARFRLCSERSVNYDGLAPDGEVEDYKVNISGNLDYGDAPRPYPTLLVENGARHVRNPDVFLGTRIDTEPDGQPDLSALGDDMVGPDEDGVTFTSLLVPGTTASVRVRASTSGLLHAWIDFNADGDWADAGEKIFNGVGLSGGTNNLTFSVPAGAVTGPTFARFRFSLQTANLDFVGLAPNGEVEDYRVSITPDRERCDLDCSGREFWLAFPGNYAPDPDNPPQLTLCIQGPAGTAAQVEIPGIGFVTNVAIPASQSRMVTIPRAAELGDLNDSVTNKGIHVVASAQVSVTAFNHARYTSDSYLALNASVLGTDYIVLGYGNLHTGIPLLNGSQFAIVAIESNTVVAINPTANAGSRVAGVPYLIVLQQPGDTYQLRCTNDAPNDLSGTIIKSSKPVAVFGGHQNTSIPSDTVWFQDYLVEQLLPVNTWGNDFYTSPLATRSLGDRFRFLAAYDNTTVFVNGVGVATLDRGKFHEMTIAARSRITSDRPIFVAQYATSGDFDMNTNADPFMLTVQATRHYSTGYRICTPTADFPTNFVHLIVPAAAIATVQIDGAPVGAGAFTAIPGTAYSNARVLVAPGSHIVTAAQPFSVSVYGWAEYDSYGHPACFYFGDVAPPRVTTSTGAATASVDDYPNTPGFVPAPDFNTSAVAQDNCDPEVPRPTQTPRPGVLIPPGVHTITVSVVDSSGNIGETNVILTVVDPSPVEIECPDDIVVNCQGDNGAIVNFNVTAHTTYDPNVPVVSTPPSGSFFPAGTTVVTNVATSLAGNTDICTFTVTVVCDRRVGVTRTANGIEMSWSSGGTLQTALSPAGPWTPVPTDGNTYVAPLTGERRFFRVQY